jgi:hypothetical protein|tara:strand:- start:1232 stop:1828 length:597 start_codon:yes stop_codon:yes gene_type:complete
MPKERKYTRREALKAGARVVGGAAAYGTAGYFSGKGYRAVKEVYDEGVGPVVERIQSLNPFKRKQSKGKTGSEGYTRRGLFRKFLGNTHKHPIRNLTATGLAYGGVKTGIGVATGRANERAIAKLRDKVAGLEERIKKYETLITIGIIGMVFSIFSATFSFTGYSIFEGTSKIILSNIIIFLISLILILFGIYKIKKK